MPLQAFRDLVRAMNELPSVGLTEQFLRSWEDYGSQRLVVRMVAVARDTGVAGLPASDDLDHVGTRLGTVEVSERLRRSHDDSNKVSTS